MGRQLHSAELRCPVRTETTMRRATDRIFIDADPGRKESRYQVVFTRTRATGRNHSAHGIFFELLEVRAQAADNFLALELDQKVEAILAGELDRGSKCKSQLDKLAVDIGSDTGSEGNRAHSRPGPGAVKKAAAGLEEQPARREEGSRLPQRM